MKIVILTQYFLPEMGAPQSRLYELAKGLQQYGWEVSIVTAMPNYPTGKIFQKYKGKFTCQEEVDGLPVKRFWIHASNSPRVFPRIVSMLSFSFTILFSLFFIRSRKAEYLLVESPPLTLGFSAWILSRLSGSKMIMNVSDIWPLSAKELGAMSDGFLYKMLERMERFLYRRSDLCTGQSDEIVAHINAIKTKNVFLFRNGVDVNRFKEGTFDPAKRKVLVYAGLLGVAQGIYSICQNVNFKELDAEFHIYGSGAELKNIEAYITANPDKGIKYMGVLSRDHVPVLLNSYGGALIALVKNIYGAVPSKIYEAMAAGLPIIFSGEGEGAAIISKHHAGWISPSGNWNVLRDNISKFALLGQEEFNRKRDVNKAVAKEYFDRTIQIKKFNNFVLNSNE